MSTSREQQIEAILFYKAAPVQVRTLAKVLECSEQDIFTSLDILESELESRGVQLIHKDNAVLLATAKSVSDIISKIAREDLQADIGKAALETLSVILYQGPIARTEIDFIRGVNSTYILRTLLMRGLIERTVHPENKRSYIYRPTFKLLQFLGITRLEDLPDYSDVRQNISSFKEAVDNDPVN